MTGIHRLATATVFAAVAFGAASCMGAPVKREAAALTPTQAEKLDRHLAGKTAGEPRNCIPANLADNSIRVSENIILYRVSRRLVYRNDLKISCPRGFEQDRDIIVTKTTGTQLCEGDILQLVDRSTGIGSGFCTLGEFTPYRSSGAS